MRTKRRRTRTKRRWMRTRRRTRIRTRIRTWIRTKIRMRRRTRRRTSRRMSSRSRSRKPMSGKPIRYCSTVLILCEPLQKLKNGKMATYSFIFNSYILKFHTILTILGIGSLDLSKKVPFQIENFALLHFPH